MNLLGPAEDEDEVRSSRKNRIFFLLLARPWNEDVTPGGPHALSSLSSPLRGPCTSPRRGPFTIFYSNQHVSQLLDLHSLLLQHNVTCCLGSLA
jgi:hypothetical protein